MGKIKIDGKEIITSSKDLVSANIIKMTVGTNCPKGGDSGHGGRTYFCLEDNAATNWSVIIDGEVIDEPNKIEIILKGDCECDTFADALASAAYRIRWQNKINK